MRSNKKLNNSLLSAVSKHQEKIRYLIAGGWNTLFGYCTFAALLFIFAKQLHYILILVITYVISVSNAYVSYKFLVFRTKGNYLREYLRFYLVYGAVFVANLILLPISVELLNIKPLISQAMIIAGAVVISYFGHKHYSFQLPIEAEKKLNKF